MLLFITILDQESQEHRCLINTNYVILVSQPADDYWRRFAVDNIIYSNTVVPTGAKSFIEVTGGRGYFVAESLAEIASLIDPVFTRWGRQDDQADAHR